MTHPKPFVREGGAGPRVVCIHANASSSSQWRGLIDLLSPRHHVIAPDSYGSGKSPDWHSDRLISLRDEVALIEPVLVETRHPCVLVGHSYGAAVALIAALAHPAKVRALALYEPTLFSLIDGEGPTPNEADGIRNAVHMASTALERGDKDAAAETFITTGWAMALGQVRLNRANRPSPRRSRMCEGGRTPFSPSPRLLRRFVNSISRFCTWSAAAQRPQLTAWLAYGCPHFLRCNT